MKEQEQSTASASYKPSKTKNPPHSAMTDIVIMRTNDFTSAVFFDALKIRTEVFVVEQGCSAENEVDAFDDVATHWVSYVNNIPTATLRAFAGKDGENCVEWIIGRISVLKAYRRRRIATRMLLHVEKELERLSMSTSKRCVEFSLHAQVDKLELYRNLDYAVDDVTVFYEEGMPHLHMKKSKTLVIE